MLAPPIQWPKVLGISCGAIALGLVMSLTQSFWWSYGVVRSHADSFSWSVLLLSASLLALSFPLYHARNWARQAVLVIGSCLAMTAMVVVVSLAVLGSRIYDAPEITGWLRIQQVVAIITIIGSALAILSPHLLILYLLRHRNVIAEFIRGNERSNNTMQQTAPRSDA